MVSLCYGTFHSLVFEGAGVGFWWGARESFDQMLPVAELVSAFPSQACGSVLRFDGPVAQGFGCGTEVAEPSRLLLVVLPG